MAVLIMFLYLIIGIVYGKCNVRRSMKQSGYDMDNLILTREEVIFITMVGVSVALFWPLFMLIG